MEDEALTLVWRRNTDSEKEWAVYLIEYSGEDLPRFYVGFVRTIRLIEEGYHGSLTSQRWAELWHSTWQSNPELFKRTVLITTDEMSEASDIETRILDRYDARHNDLFANMTNGFGGWALMKHTEKTKAKMSQTLKGNTFRRGKKTSEEGRRRQSESLRGLPKPDKFKRSLSEAWTKRKADWAKLKIDDPDFYELLRSSGYTTHKCIPSKEEFTRPFE